MTKQSPEKHSAPEAPPADAPAPGGSAAMRLLSSESLRWIVTAIAIPATVGLWGFFTERMASAEREERQKVETTQRNVDLVIKLLPGLNKEPGSIERLNAIAVLQALEAHGTLTPELRAAIEGFSANIKADVQARYAPAAANANPGVAREVEVLAGAAAAPRSDQLAQGATAVRAPVVTAGRVYSQIFDESQRAAATALQQRLRANGIAMPGIENVTATAEKKGVAPPKGYPEITLLVFHTEDTALADQIARLAAEAGLPLKIQSRADTALAARVPLGQLEVWWPGNR